jgi:hypothetical protein
MLNGNNNNHPSGLQLQVSTTNYNYSNNGAYSGTGMGIASGNGKKSSSHSQQQQQQQQQSSFSNAPTPLAPYAINNGNNNNNNDNNVIRTFSASSQPNYYNNNGGLTPELSLLQQRQQQQQQYDPYQQYNSPQINSNSFHGPIPSSSTNYDQNQPSMMSASPSFAQLPSYSTKNSTKMNNNNILQTPVAGSTPENNEPSALKITIFSISAIDLPKVHRFKSNSPLCSIACGRFTSSTEVSQHTGSFANWENLEMEFTIDQKMQLRFLLSSLDQTIGVCKFMKTKLFHGMKTENGFYVVRTELIHLFEFLILCVS